MTPEERKARITELQTQFKELDQPKYESSGDLARQRGNEFEVLIRQVFEAWEMLRRGPYHTADNKSEQIDGVVQFNEVYALLEVKWEKSNLAASSLFAFLGKVDGKFVGTIGIYVSRNKLTSNFLNALRAGRRQCILVLHGDDVDLLFDPDFNLKAYLKHHYMHICMDNSCHLSAKKYLKKAKKEAAAAKAAKAAAAAPAPAPQDIVGQKINECLADKTTENIVNEFAEQLDAAQQIEALTRIIQIYAEQASSPSADSSWRVKNLTEFARELILRLPAAHTAADTAFFVEKLSKEFKNTIYHPLLELFADRCAFLTPGEKTMIEDRLKLQWDKIVSAGDWVPENPMADATRAIWQHLTRATKDHLIKHFVGFILSNRRANHEQHQLARSVLKEDESLPAARLALMDHARKAGKSWFAGEVIDEAYITKGKSRIKRSLSDMDPYIDNFDEIVDEAAEAEAAIQAANAAADPAAAAAPPVPLAPPAPPPPPPAAAGS